MSNKKTHTNSSDFKNYFSGKQSDAQKNKFKEQIADSEFEKEALEGFESLENNAEASRLIDEVNNEIREKTGLKKSYGTVSFPVKRVLSAAAAVLVLFGFGFLINQQLKSDENIVVQNESLQETPFSNEGENNEESTTENEIILEDEIIDDFEIEPPVAEDKNTGESTILPPPPPPEIDVVEDDIAEVYESEETALSITEEEEVLADVAQAAPKQAKSESNANVVSQNIANEAVETAKASATMRAKNSSDYDKASDFFKANEYQLAIPFYQSAVANNQNKESASYDLAMCYYHLQKNNKAKNAFDDIISKRGLYANNAKWFTSMILINEGRIEIAKNLLQELADGNSGFKNQAIDKLKTLD